jgi:hypothetical protein
MLASCGSAADGTLLASDLTYLKQDKGWTKSIEIDPWLVTRPSLVRHLRSERSKAMDEGRWDCPVDFGCHDRSEFRLMHDGERLVSIVEEQDFFGGGAHGIAGVSDYLYDLKIGKRIRFGDIFVSWSNARPLLQEAFCETLKWTHEDATECPDIQKQAISLLSVPSTGKVDAFIVETQDYALGYYAAGRATIRVEITAQIYGLIRPEFQQEFIAI